MRILTHEERESIRIQLHNIIEDWLGLHIPEDGTEDFATWQGMEVDLESCETLSDFCDFAGGDWLLYLQVLDVDNLLDEEQLENMTLEKAEETARSIFQNGYGIVLY